MDELVPGAKIERYIVEEKIGEGGMAAVYKVRHSTLNTAHALKVLTIGGKKLRRRLVQEGRVQAMVNHPHVVAVRDVLEVDGAPALLMDFVEGCDLEEWIAAEKPDPELATAVFRQVINAVEAAHERGLIHRDLKPANVLMRRLPDGSWEAKVADFGLAKALEEGEANLGLTREGAAMGTPAFMAPEQIRDASSVDHQADIWALGCIYYQLLTGEQAFDGLDIVEVFNSVSDGNYTAPSAIRPHLAGEIDETIAGCLTVDPERRFHSCAALRASLDGLDAPSRADTTWDGIEVQPKAPQDKVLSTQPADVRQSAPAPPPVAPEPEEPSTPSKPTPLGWAIPLVMALVIGGGSIAGVFGLAMVGSTLLTPSCTGWVRGPLVFGKTEGSSWTPMEDKDVVVALPSEDNEWTPTEGSCTIERGSTITLVEDPVRLGRNGIWIRVLPSNVEAPEPEPTDDE